jgi:hypothetical protein
MTKNNNNVKSKKFEKYFEVRDFLEQENSEPNSRYVTCSSKTGEVFVDGDVNISSKNKDELPNFNTTTISGDFNLDGEIDFNKLPAQSNKIKKTAIIVNIPNDKMIKKSDLAKKGFDKSKITEIYFENRLKHFIYKKSEQLNKFANRFRKIKTSNEM